MATCTIKCPECGWKENLLSSRPDRPPPCPRCPGVVRMQILPPPEGQQTAWGSRPPQQPPKKD